MLDRIKPDSSLNTISTAIRLQGPLALGTLERSLNEIAQRHETLRTIFADDDGRPVQVVVPSMTLTIRMVDLTFFQPPELERELERLITAETQLPFDLSLGPLVRATLFKLGEEENVVLLCLHQIICDSHSIEICMAELAAVYTAAITGQPALLPELPVQYADFALYQRELLNPQALDELMTVQRRRFSAELPTLELPVDRQRPAVETFHAAKCYLEVDASLIQSLEALSRREGVALSTILLAAFIIQLRRYSSQDEILVGVLVGGREPEETRELIGLFVNTLVLRTDLSDNPTFREFLQRVRETVAEAHEHQEIPFEKLVEALQPERDISRHPIVQAMFTMHDTSPRSMVLPGIGATVVEIKNRTTTFDLSTIWTRNEERLAVVLEYNPDLFEASTVERMAKHSESVLQSIVSNPEQRVLNLPFLTSVEQQQLLGEWNKTSADYPAHACLHEMFEALVSDSPDLKAVISEDEQLTYAQLNRRANEVARRLRASGVGPGVVAGICIERSIEMVVGLMGIVKAGGAYLPLDPTYPPERLSFMLKDARAKIVLTQERLVEQLGHQLQTEVICIDSQWQGMTLSPDENVRSGVTPDDLVYVIYTSGSTGQPKGVMLNHRGRVNNFSDFNRRFDVGKGDRLLALSSLSFDMCAYDVFGTLAAGATIVLPVAARTLDPSHWADLMVRHEVSLWHSVPALLELLVEYVEAHAESRPYSLRLALLGGDWIPVSLPDRVRALAEHVQVISLGGATEASMDSTIFPIETSDPTWKSIPYGRPMANQQAYVLDKSLQLVPVGVSGELYLGGLGLAWGYFDRPDLTAERFIPHPFGRKPGERLYYTGDLARYYPDGNLELIGRSDFQVKIRGFRIELGEIAAALRQHPAVYEAVVLAREDEPGIKRLVAYIVPQPEGTATVRRMLRLEQEVARNDLAQYELPNGTSIIHLNKGETSFLYHEIFEEQAYLRNGITLDEKPCIFDVGANIGLFSLFIGQTYPDARIYAFEPVPDAFQALRANANIYGLDAKVFESGISDQNKSSTLTYYPNFSIGSSRFADPLEARDVIKAFLTNTQQLPAVEQSTLSEALVDELLDEKLTSQEIVCEFRTISSVIAEYDIENIDLLKVDVEKSEVEVLAGIAAEDWVKIQQIVIEVHGRDRLELVVPLLESHNFGLVIEQSGTLKETALYNVYAVREDKARVVDHQPQPRLSAEPVDRWSNPRQLSDEISAFLKERLPEYMLPAALVLLEALPLTPNGKVDRRGLPKPEATLLRMQPVYSPPVTAVEQVLAGFWMGLLGIKQIGLNDNFFQLGGHSILATQLISRIRGMLHVDLSLRSIFDAPTLAAQAQEIEMAQRTGQGWQFQPILPVSRESEMPASYAQQRLWFVDKLAPNSAVYNIAATIRLTGELNQPALQQSLDEIISRHETLRTSIAVVNEKPVQIIAPPLGLEMSVVNLSEMPEAERQSTAGQLAGEEAERPFDLSRSPLIRVKLLRLAGNDHLLLLTTHHIVSDGWSLEILVRELAALYTSFATGERSTLAELPIQYADFAQWQQSLPVQMLEAQLTYWSRHLDGAAVLDLPIDRPRPPMPSYRGSTQTFLVPASLTESLKELSQREGATLYMILLAAFQTLLHRYSGQDDIVVGTPIANRNRTEIEGLIGFFVNMLVMRSRLSGELKFSELLAQIRESALEAYAHKDLPFERLVEELQSERDLSRHPLFQVAFALQPQSAFKLELPELQMQLLPYEEKGAKFDLTLLMEETTEGLFGSLSYSTDLFDDSTAARMLEHLQRMLEAIASNPNQRLADLPMVGEAERQQLLFDWNDTDTEYAREHCVHQLFEAQVDLTPDAIAIGDGGESLSYRDLNLRANQLAHYLRAEGVGPESLVGVMMERSAEMVVALLGILKAGGAYIPLDLSYPKQRLGFMLEDSRAQVLLTHQALVDLLPEHGTKVLCLDTESKLILQQSGDNLESGATAESLAYVIYTSGSTGHPKGVCISHRAINRLFLNTNYVEIKSSDRIAQASNSSFDAATFEIWGALLHGARLIILSKDEVITPRILASRIEEHEISIMFVTTALFNQVATELPDCFRRLRQLMFGGEACEPRWVDEVLRKGSPERLMHVYGPTECTTFTTWFLVTEVEKGALTIPIGRPIANTKVYLLDKNLQPVPVGLAGEVYIGGDGPARGYLNHPELTAEKLVPDPFGVRPGARLYKTGDLARYLRDGSIVFDGRIDQQVKMRGFRIELEEIETVLNRHAGVQQSIVMARTEGMPAGEKRLVGYVIAEDGVVVDAAELRSYLKEQLPEYMVPTAFVQLEQLPVTLNGKVDRRALPEPEWSVGTTEYRAATTVVEELLLGIWAEVLGSEVGQIGVGDNFFEMGGHSLLATQVVSRVRQVFKVEMPVRVVFEQPVMEQQAAWIEEEMRAGGASVEQLPMERISREQPLALSFAQQRLWFLSQLEPDNPFYNVPLAIRFTGHLDLAGLEHAFNEIIRRHEALRTSFTNRDGLPVQVIAPQLKVKIRATHLEQLGATEQEREIGRLSSLEARQPFDLAHGPLLRVKLLRLGSDEHMLLLTMHHIVSDGWSVGVLIREMAALYDAYVSGRSAGLPELAIQYADFAHWQREWLSGPVLEGQMEYWRRQLAGVSGVLELPTDRVRPPVQSYSGATYSFVLPPSLRAELDKLNRQEGVTLFMTLLAAWQTLLSRYSGQYDIVVGTPIANRNRSESEGLIGCFLNTLAMRSDLSGNPPFRELLRQVRETALAGFANQDVAFEMLVEELEPERNLGHTPLFQVMFTLHNAPLPKMEFADLKLDLHTVENGTSKLDLVLNITEEAQGLVGLVEYNTDLFDAASIARMMQHFETLLVGVVAHPERSLLEQPLLTEAEEQRLLFDWNNSRRDYQPSLNIHQLFEAQVELSPQAPAVVFAEAELTYRELNAKANQLAHYLKQQGVGRGVCVGICLEHSLEIIIAILGVLKAGGAYVPLDPGHPKSRTAFVIDDAQISLVLSQGHLSETLLADRANVVCLDTEWDVVTQQSDQNPPCEVTPSDLAYIIYTSGSTGAPKGVKIEHKSLVNYIRWALEVYLQNESATFALYSSLAFDLTVTSIYTPLVSGNKLIVYRKEGRETPVFQIMQDNQVGVLKLTPSHLMLIKDRDNRQSQIKRLIVGGEVLRADLALQIHESFGEQVEIYNEYGPTEATVGCMIHRFDPYRDRQASVPIGQPAANVQIYVLDEALQPVAENVTGELYISGTSLAQGYLNREALTEERFLANPFISGERIYKSGDLARRLRGGTIEYLGRTDEQVKFQGYRVELNEIRSALNHHPHITDSVVVVLKDETGNDLMVAYCVTTQELEATHLREWLSESIIEETIPNIFARLDELPLTVNGKIDYAALPRIEDIKRKTGSNLDTASSPIEKLLAGIWAEVLGIEASQIGVADNFFEMGGHSLLAILVVSRVREVFNIELPVRSLFQAPTVTKLAVKVESYLRAGGASVEQMPMERISREQPLALSFAQQRLWFLSQLEPDNPFYNVPLAIRFSGQLYLAALEHAFNEIIRRHEALRTSFANRDGLPVQVITAQLSVNLRVTHLEQLAAAEQEREVARLSSLEARQPFDLGQGPLLRVKLLRLGAKEHMLLLTMHHIVSDGWSMGVLVREMAALYEAYVSGRSAPLPELTIQYADFAHWQREWLSGTVLEGQMEYWRKQLAGVSGVLELPTDRVRPPVQSYRGAIFPFELSSELTKKLKALSQQSGATLFMTLLAGFNILMQRYTGQEDILVASPTANRNRPEIEGLIGFFVNALLLRGDLSGDPTFEELLARLRETALEAYTNQDVPFEKLVEELQPTRDMSRHPLFQVIFSLQDTSLNRLTLPGLKLKMLPIDNRTSLFDLTLLMEERGDELGGIAQYNTDLFDAATIERMIGCFQSLLEGIVSNPQLRISTLPLMSGPEQRQLLLDTIPTSTEYGRQFTVSQIFEAQVARAPESIALVFEDRHFSYADLNERANQLADYLRQYGVGPESLVAVHMHRSVEIIVAILAILKAGAAYLPLDTSYPVGRLRTILHDAQPAVLITQSSLRDQLAAEITLHVLSIDSDWPSLAPIYSSANPLVVAHPDNLAYLMYTSGSTGEPKGIAITHRSIVRLVKETNYASFSHAEVFLLLAPLSFDASTFEIWGALLNGARLVVMPPGALSLTALGNLLVRQQVTTLWLTASLFDLMVDEHLDDLRGIHQLLTGGDVLSASHVTKALKGLRHCTLSNCYGPTENTTFTCTYPMTHANQAGATLPIGASINNTRVYVLDGEMKPVPVGVPGLLYTGGDGLARGYFEQPGMTAEKFVPDPLSGEAGARLYGTGDVVKYRADGLLEFIGRRDAQIKVRGFRIELGEIEAVLSGHEQVRQCVVVALTRTEEPGSVNEEKRLVAYVVAEDDAVTGAAELRSYLKQQLPEYMVPAAFLFMETIPVTANGKVDRTALPEPEWNVNATTYRGVASVSEELLVGIWAEVLGIEAGGLGIADNFFEIGGHSLVATQVVSRVRQVFKREMPVRVVFEQPTVEEQAAWIEEHMLEGEARDEQLSMEPISRDQPLALSFAQQRLWFLDQLSPGSTAYNISSDMTFEGPLDLTALEASVNEVVRRHETLRTTFAVVNGQPVQVIAPIAYLTLPVVNLEGSVAGQRETMVQRTAQEDREIPFDLTVGPLIKLKLLRFGVEDHVLLLSMHHIITDAWSEGILFGELRTLYQAFSAGEPSPLPELEFQYADFSAWQRKWVQGTVLEAQLAYWKKQLADAPAMLELPTDKPRPAVQSSRGARQSWLLSEELTQGLRTLCQREATTLFMTLLAAFQTLLSRYTGQEDIVIGSPVAGRNRAEVEGLIGFFINTLVLRGDLREDPTFTELLRRVRDVALEAYGQQDLPFEKLIEELNLGRDLRRTPLFQVFFNLLNASGEADQTLSAAAPAASPFAHPGVESTKSDLTLYAVNYQRYIRLDLVYNTDLFEAATITGMLGHFETLLAGILANPEQRLSTLPIIAEVERQQLMGRNNLVQPAIGFVQFDSAAGGQTIVSRFAEQVRLYPENIALKSKQCEWSYQTLDAMSERVSRQIQELPERICLLFEHDAPMILGVLATLKAGKTYVPLDPQYPLERLSFILKDAQAGAILTNSRNLIAAQKLSDGVVPVVNIDALDAVASDEHGVPQIEPGTMAYILYTSGSAGQPKGVMQSHRNVLRHIGSYTNNLHLCASDRLTLLSSYSFDAAVMDIYGALLNGATLCLFNLKDEGLEEFSDWLMRQEITIYHSTPTVYRYFVGALVVAQDFPRIRLVVLGGEAVFKRDVELYRKHFSSECIFVNGLGPTESTVTLQYLINKDSPLADNRVPVGYPVEDTEVLLLNGHRESVAAYAIGEIAIKSDHVALGYWQQPIVTEQAFSQNDEDGNRRIYYTGDLGRLLPDGSIEFLGRKDFQVKIRGYKIDFSEIETCILKSPGIREALVNASDDQGGNRRLAAYIVCDPQQAPDLEELRRYVSEQLPDYMMPAAFVLLDALPLTPTGKLDRRALPSPDWTGLSSPVLATAPRTPIEEVLAGIWAEVLDIEVDQLGMNDNFFQRGGHSLLATLVISRVREAFQIKFPLRMMFHTPTIAGLAEAIMESLLEQGDSEQIEKLLREIEDLALTTPALV